MKLFRSLIGQIIAMGNDIRTIVDAAKRQKTRTVTENRSK